MRLAMVIGVVVTLSGAIDAAAEAAAADTGDQEDWPSLFCTEPFEGESVAEGRFTGGPDAPLTRLILSAP